MKKIITLIITALFLSSCASIDIANNFLNKNEKEYNIKIQYPQISGKSKAIEKINTEIFSVVEMQKNDFINICSKYYNENSFSHPWELVISWELSKLTKTEISAVLTSYNYTGGAHGMTTLFAINYNLKTGDEIKLKTIAKTYSKTTDLENWLQKLSVLVYPKAVAEIKSKTKELENYIIDKDWIKSGTSPTIENYQNFTLSDDSIVFYFGQYTIAPYALGISKVPVLLSELAFLPEG